MTTPAEIEDAYTTPMGIAWQWDYEVGIEKLRALYAKSKRLQWNAETDLDWSRTIDPSRPVVDEGRFGFERVPFLQRLSAS